MDSRKRPRSVTLIAWILIVVSSYYLVNAIGEPNFRRSFRVSKALAVLSWLVISGFLGVVSGIAILKGLNWGRLLCLCYMPISIISFNLLMIFGFGFLKAGYFKVGYLILSNILAITFYIIAIRFLTRSASLAFFTLRSSKG